jgi:hypothetical protein
MAALSITAANVAAGAAARKSSGIAGATITAGQLLYQDPADLLLKLADSDAGTAPPRSPVGIALHGASSGQPVAYLVEGPCTIGAALTAGVAYYASPTAGGISPVADLVAGNYPTIVGIAASTTVLDVRLHPSGVSL